MKHNKALRFRAAITMAACMVLTFGSVLPASTGEEENRFVWVGEEDPGSGRDLFSGKGGPYIGVYLEEVDAEAVKKLDLKEESGARITRIAEGSPAEKAGLKDGDVIVRWNREQVHGVSQLKRMVSETPVGRSVLLTVVREGKEKDLKITVRERKAGPGEFGFFHGGEERDIREYVLPPHVFPHGKEMKMYMDDMKIHAFGKPRLGVRLQDLTDQLAEYFRLGDRPGVLITSVIEDSAAEQAGLKAGDILLSIEGEKTATVGDVMEAIGEREEGDVKVNVLRRGEEKTFTATLEKKHEPDLHKFIKNKHRKLHAAPGRENIDIEVIKGDPQVKMIIRKVKEDDENPEEITEGHVIITKVIEDEEGKKKSKIRELVEEDEEI